MTHTRGTANLFGTPTWNDPRPDAPSYGRIAELLWEEMLLRALAEALGPAETPDDVARYLAVADAVNERVPALAWDLWWNGATWPERKVRRRARVVVQRALLSRPSVA